MSIKLGLKASLKAISTGLGLSGLDTQKLELVPPLDNPRTLISAGHVIGRGNTKWHGSDI